ncbi:phosphoribosylformylglycinamidine synthase [Clostridium sp. BJN0001]|uniref:phosphoribosylformylglycinamidine synthase n=1 Tax=Clostridium sp. BJN0001 TaxID=2930219 RepID=UPI001FD3B008|nr:phosphoribosylformylglycinamidine synthase [Clostridium sp. BJN0001]
MSDIRTIFVEKKNGFNVEAQSLLRDFRENLGIKNLKNVRLINKYIIGDLKEDYYKKSLHTIFSEATVDTLTEGEIKIPDDEIAFAVEYLPGQYDQRADSASECLALLAEEDKITIKSAKIITLKGSISKEDLEKIKNYYINPVDSREVDINSKELSTVSNKPKDVQILDGFSKKSVKELEEFHKENGLAMSIDDLVMIQDYFKNEEKREPSITEIKVIDTYWSDHCRHTTFSTILENVEIEDHKYLKPLKKSYDEYLEVRKNLYTKKKKNKTLMDIALVAMKELKRTGKLNDLDISEEINACSINVTIDTDKGKEDYLVMFKNETHNHPTEIEPFGGAATCLGGAIRDPLSGRTYVYQAMRVTGAADPTVSIEKTLKGKLPQRKITLGAAHGYSSYGNQIGLATGGVYELYHPNYAAKRMEVGAVIAAAPKENVVREEPALGDVIILLGGRTGRDGVGGATGSSKEHTVSSLSECGAEVQKGNAPTERKLQRLFRNARIAKMIKRCNDFGAGGVSVAIGELCRGLDINLDKVTKKYEGLDGTELAVSESQERMAVVVSKENADEFIETANKENLEANLVANVTDTDRLRLFWRGKNIVDLKRTFLDTNGATQKTKVIVNAPSEYPYEVKKEDTKKAWIDNLRRLNVASEQGLSERFDSTIGGGTVLMPFGGKYSKTPAEGMSAKIPVLNGLSKDATLMTYGFNPYLGAWSPYHMAYYSVIESVTKLVSMGGNFRKSHLTFQEYFEHLGNDPKRWGKPFAALLGAFEAQMRLEIAAIGGKDSMSGTFDDLDVPPSLVSFAVGVEKAAKVISPEFKKAGSKLVLLTTEKKDDMTIDIDKFINNMDGLYKLIQDEKVISASAVKFGGVCENVSKMSLGNRVGADLKNLTSDELFGFNYGDVLVEVKEDVDIKEAFNGLLYKEVGNTKKEKAIEVNGISLSIDEIEKAYEEKLSKVFPIKTEETGKTVETPLYERKENISPCIKTAKPRVVIPVFPGTNCEYDCERAFKKEGAETSLVVFNNLTKEGLVESIERLSSEIKKSQIIMLPGGFSAGDEPDGSGKFIANVFRNEKVKEQVMELLKNRDGLMLGICNGFQALIKLGLVPYGEIVDIKEDMATLTYNNIDRHMSSIIRTKIVSNKSPWFNEVKAGDIHSVAISHGEGRFVAPESLIKKLFENGQVATQYVDFDGKASLDMPYNPNGSMDAIEGITSPDGRILGKMGHSERIGEDLYRNMEGNFDQKIFKSGVNYFK